MELPFQTIETINLPCGTRQEELFGGKDDGWKNRLIWGDNLLVMGSLLKVKAYREDASIYISIAYAGAALPLLLLFYNAGSTFLTINREIFAAEIIRTVVGSTAIILTVPITAAIAVFLLMRKKLDKLRRSPVFNTTDLILASFLDHAVLYAARFDYAFFSFRKQGGFAYLSGAEAEGSTW